MATEQRTALRWAPGPRGLPFVGNIIGFARDPLGFSERIWREHGDVASVRGFGQYFVLLSHPDEIERVLVKDAALFQKDRFTHGLRDVLGQGLLTSEGDFWRRQRRLAQPAFHHDRIRGYARLMVERSAALAESWCAAAAQGPRDVRGDLMGLTLDIVTRALFSAEIGAQAAVIGDALDVVMREAMGVLGSGLRFPLRVPTPGNLRLRRATASIDSVVVPLIRARRAAPPRAADAPGRGDLLELLLSARDDDGAGMDDRQLRDEVVTLMLAGHETTALTLTFALWLLGEHPAELAALHAEISHVLGGRDATFDDVPQLRHAERVILETMRLYPPAWAIGREALADYELAGYHIPKGTQLQVTPYVVHRQERFFPEPLAFRPDRWAGDLQKRLPRFAYFPFGGGPRICIGNAFAKLEAVLALVTLLQRCDVRLVPGQKMVLVPSITLRPKHPLRCTLAPRR